MPAACEQCKKEFVPRTKRNRFCSKECYDAYKPAYRRKRWKEKAEQYRAAQRRQKANRLARMSEEELRQHKETVKARTDAWQKRHPERVAQYRATRKADKAKCAATRRRWRLSRTTAQRLYDRVRNVMLGHVRRRECKLLEPPRKLIGCDKEALCQHIEQQMREGMAWDNYGSWHIDHKQPVSSFDLSQLTEQRACFHYSNLQPLWGHENLKKADSVS